MKMLKNKDYFDLFNSEWIYKFFTSNYYPLAFQVPLVIILVGLIIDGFLGINSDENSIIYGLFNVFWFLIIFSSLVLSGRSWCAVCPVGAISGAVNRFSQGKSFPKKLSNWGIALISYVVGFWVVFRVLDYSVTPFWAAVWISGFICIAVTVSFLFKDRVFCKYLCPITAPLGVMARVAPVELRTRAMRTTKNIKNKSSQTLLSKNSDRKRNNQKIISKISMINKSDPSIRKENTFGSMMSIGPIDFNCKSCITHDCHNGNYETEGCPWGEHPANLVTNATCSMCMKCVHSCPSTGKPLRLSLRLPFSELWQLFRPNIFEGLTILVLLAIFSFGSWTFIINDITGINFHESLVSYIKWVIPYSSSTVVEQRIIGDFIPIGLLFGLYSIPVYISSKLVGMKFSSNFSNFAYAYLVIFIFHGIFLYSIDYLPKMGNYFTISLNNLGIHLYLSGNFLTDFTTPVLKLGDNTWNIQDLFHGIPVIFAIPIAGYIIYKISNNLSRSINKKQIWKCATPHIIMVTIFVLAIMYQELIIDIR